MFMRYYAKMKDAYDFTPNTDDTSYVTGLVYIITGENNPSPYLQDHFHITEENMDQGRWHLILGTAEWLSDDLPMLEAKLMEFAKGEGYTSQTFPPLDPSLKPLKSAHI